MVVFSHTRDTDYTLYVSGSETHEKCSANPRRLVVERKISFTCTLASKFMLRSSHEIFRSPSKYKHTIDMNFERVESRHRCFRSQFREPIAELDISKMSSGFSRCHGSFAICVPRYTAGNVSNNRIYIRVASRPLGKFRLDSPRNWRCFRPSSFEDYELRVSETLASSVYRDNM